MKNKIILAISLLTTGIAFSQTPEERAAIVEYYKSINDGSEEFDFKKYPMNEKELADIKAKSLGIPLEVVDASGRVGSLVRFDGDLPLYYATTNEGAAITTRANTLQPGGSLGLSLAGQGMMVGVWDQTRPLSTHNGFRDASGLGATRVTSGDSSAEPISTHATHVMGTILSSGYPATGVSGRGMAYEASGYAYDWNNDIAEMSSIAGFGLLISNHSYGLQAQNLPTWYFGAYVSDSNAVDNVCFNNPYYQPVYAAGNDRGSFSTYNPTKNGNDLLSGDKTSKNSIIVGAVNEVSSYIQPSSVVMSSFSNYGPTDDFRIKPDIVAKGVDVYSTIDSSVDSYGSMSGTSMASPNATGSLLLVQQYYGAPYLKAATLKGLALHTADEAGSSSGPDQMFGWGLLNVGKMVQVLQAEGTESIVEENVLMNGVSHTFNVMALGTESLKASISWTDRPGTAVVSGSLDNVIPKLVNDLDIRVTQLTNTYYPWKLNMDWSNLVAIQADNNVDPFERVDIDNPSGVYQITITNKGTLVGGLQNYSLVVTGVDADALLSNSTFDQGSGVVWVDKDFKVLNFSLLEAFVGGSVNIFDCNGRLVYANSSIESNEGTVQLNDVQNGVYIVKFVSAEGKVLTEKIVL